MFHKWDRSDRPLFGADVNKSKYYERINTLAHSRISHANNIRNTIFKDKEYRDFLDEKWGIDLLGRQGTQKIKDAGLDPYYFYSKENIFISQLKVVE